MEAARAMQSRAATAPTANKREERRVQMLSKQRWRLEQEVKALESDILALVGNASSGTNPLPTYICTDSNARKPFDHTSNSFPDIVLPLFTCTAEIAFVSWS